MNTIEESQPGAVPTIEVSNRTRMDVKKDYVLGDPFKIRFRIEEFKPGEGNEDGSGSWTSPEVLRGGKKFSIVVSGGDQTFLQATVKTEDTFDGSIELVLVNQANATRNMRCRGPTGSFVLKPEVLKNNGNGWVQATCLIVEAECREFVKAEVLWNPKPVLSNNMRTLLHTGAGADMIFSVQGLSFSAHSCIVSLSSPVLGVVGSTDGDGGYSLSGDMEEIEIIGVQPGVFKELLCFIYVDEKTDEKVWRDSTLELLEAADRFHVHRLKLLAELYLCSQSIALDRVAEMLVFAESHSCPQLKETCLGLWAENSTAIMESPSWNILSEAPLLLSELLVALNTKLTGATALQPVALLSPRTSPKATPMTSPKASPGRKVPDSPASVTSTSTSPSIGTPSAQTPSKRDGTGRRDFLKRLRGMKVGELRRALSDGGLGVDGAREVLEQRLLDRTCV